MQMLVICIRLDTYVEMLYLFPCTIRRQEACSGFGGLISVVSLSEDGGRWNIGNGALTTSGSWKIYQKSAFQYVQWKLFYNFKEILKVSWVNAHINLKWLTFLYHGQFKVDILSYLNGIFKKWK